MQAFRFFLCIPILIPAVLIWVLGLLLLTVASTIAGRPEWTLKAIGKE